MISSGFIAVSYRTLIHQLEGKKMKKVLLVALLCAMVSIVSASTTALEDSSYYTDSGVFSLANGGFSSMTWAYDDTSKTSFTLEGYGTTSVSMPICTIKGSINVDGSVTGVSVALDNLGAAGAWSDLYNGTYTVAEAEFTDYGMFRLLMTAGATAEGETANQIIIDGKTYDRGLEFQAQSWVVNDYVTGQFTNAQLTVASALVPEPATMAILGLGGLFVAMRRKR